MPGPAAGAGEGPGGCCGAWLAEMRRAQEEILDRKLSQAVRDLTASLGTELRSLRDQNGALAWELKELRSCWGPAAASGPSAAPHLGRPPRCFGDVPESTPREDALDNLQNGAYESQRSTMLSPPDGAELDKAEADMPSFKEEDLQALKKTFRSLCQHKRSGRISVFEVVEMVAKQHGFQPLHPDLVDIRPRLEGIILAVNKELGIMASPSRSEPSADITLETFLGIMRWPEASDVPVGGVADGAQEMRDIFVREDALRKVAKATSLAEDDLYKVSQPHLGPSRMERMLRYLDPFIGMVIILNAIVITISTDVARGSSIWTGFEMAFTLVFWLELAIKLVAFGPYNFFLGAEKYWNQFDMVVAIIAGLDLLFTLLGELVTLRNFTIVRLLRFARLTKLVRVLKIKVFKELALMVNGIVAGFRTLFWAVVFLAFLLFALGVILTQTVGHTEAPYWQSLCDDLVGQDSHLNCVESAEHLLRHRVQLFGNVFRSMFTVFRCFTDGCSSVDGTPLVPYFYNTQGYWAIVCYMIVNTFVIFGLFNLIMAIFVENTIDNAKRDEAKRRDEKYGEHLNVARKLQEMIIMFCTGGGEEDEEEAHSPGYKGWWINFQEWASSIFSTEINQREDSDNVRSSANLHVQVDQAAFNAVLQKPAVRDMLEELDISIGNSDTLFDILDANCNGLVEVGELVLGLVKLRGAPDKADCIAPLLAIRSMQRDMKDLQAQETRQKQAVEGIAAGQKRLQVLFEGWSRQLSENSVSGRGAGYAFSPLQRRKTMEKL